MARRRRVGQPLDQASQRVRHELSAEMRTASRGDSRTFNA